MPDVTVIIPTLQRSDRLDAAVQSFIRDPLVAEIIVINNAPTPLAWDSPAVRVLQQETNIFVNPAWNLGAREARSEFLLFANDDAIMDPRALAHAVQRLRRGAGIVFACSHCYGRRWPGPITLTPAFDRDHHPHMGVWFAMARDAYTPIPEDVKIWYGDDWLFYRQHGRKNYAMHGARFITDMSSTVKEFHGSPVIERDIELYVSRYVDQGETRAVPLGIANRFWAWFEARHQAPDRMRRRLGAARRRLARARDSHPGRDQT